MPRISLEALVCGDTKTLSLQVTLPSYFLTNQKKSNIHKPEKQHLKWSQMWTQNLLFIFSHFKNSWHDVIVPCDTLLRREVLGWSLMNSRHLFWLILQIWTKAYFLISVFHVPPSLCFFLHILYLTIFLFGRETLILSLNLNFFFLCAQKRHFDTRKAGEATKCS